MLATQHNTDTLSIQEIVQSFIPLIGRWEEQRYTYALVILHEKNIGLALLIYSGDAYE